MPLAKRPRRRKRAPFISRVREGPITVRPGKSALPLSLRLRPWGIITCPGGIYTLSQSLRAPVWFELPDPLSLGGACPISASTSPFFCNQLTRCRTGIHRKSCRWKEVCAVCSCVSRVDVDERCVVAFAKFMHALAGLYLYVDNVMDVRHRILMTTLLSAGNSLPR